MYTVQHAMPLMILFDRPN